MEIEVVNNETGAVRRIPIRAPEWSPRSVPALAAALNLAEDLSGIPVPFDQATARGAYALGVCSVMRWVLTEDESPALRLLMPPTAANVRTEYRIARSTMAAPGPRAGHELARGVAECLEWLTGEREAIVYPAAQVA